MEDEGAQFDAFAREGVGAVNAARALGAWIDATRDPSAASDATIVKTFAAASLQSAAKRATGREKTIEDVALQRKRSPRTAELDLLACAENAAYDAWRLAE